jgi:hypothetical protein
MRYLRLFLPFALLFGLTLGTRAQQPETQAEPTSKRTEAKAAEVTQKPSTAEEKAEEK